MAGFFKRIFEPTEAPGSTKSGGRPPAEVDLTRAAFEGAPVGMLVTDRGHHLVRANRAFCDLLGYTEQELMARTIGSITYPDDLSQDLNCAEKLFRGELPGYRLEKHYLAKDGRRILMEVTAAPIRGTDGAPLFRLATVRDITEQRQVEALLDRQTEELRQQAMLLDLAHDAILVRDLSQSLILFWNHGAEDLYGWGKEEALMRSSHELLRTEFPRPLAEIEATVRRAGRWEGELVHTSRGGRRLVVASRWALLPNPHGDAPPTVLEINRDVTERKRAEEARAMTDRTLRLMVEATDQGIYGIDLQGRCTFINQPGSDMLGYRVEELLGRNMHELVHHSRNDGSPYPEEDCPIYKAFRDRQAVRRDDEVLWRRDGTSFPCEYTAHPVLDAEVLKGAVVRFRNLSDRRRPG